MNNIHTIPLSSGQPQQQRQQVVQTQPSMFSLDTIKEKLSNIPPATKIILFLEIGFEILGLIIKESDTKLAFNPGYFFNNPWTIATSLFYDSSILSTILNAFLLLFIGDFFEGIWGSTEFLKFTGIVGLASNIICGFILVLVATSSEVVSLEYNLCGLSSVLMGFAVAFKQIYPDKEQSVCGYLKFTMNKLPLIILGCSLIFGLFSMFKPFLQSVVGLLVSWTYLRMYQKHTNGTVGDNSPGFAFHTMFPEVVQPTLTKIEHFFAKLLHRPISDQSELPVSTPVPSAPPQEAPVISIPSDFPVPSAPPPAVTQQQQQHQQAFRSKYGAGHVLGDE